MRFGINACVAAGVLLAGVFPSYGQVRIWMNTGESNWFMLSNWNTGTLPTSTDFAEVSGGTAVIPNSGAQAEVLTLGSGSAGGLRIESNGFLYTPGGAVVGHNAAEASQADVGGTWRFNNGLDDLWIGNFGPGELTLHDNGLLRIDNGGWIVLGEKATGTGILNIGAKSGMAAVAPGKINGTKVTTGLGTGTMVLNHNSSAYYLTSTGAAGGTPVALNGALQLRVENGTTILKTAASHTGGTTFKGGTLQVESGGVLGTNSAALTVGNASGENGTLVLSGGGKATSTLGTVGYSSGSSGTVRIAGAGSEWTTTNNGLPFVVGRSGTGVVTLADGGKLTLVDGAGDVDLGALAAGSGALNIGAAANESAAGAGVVNANSIYKGNGTGSVVFNHTGSDYWLTKNGASSGADVRMTGGLSVRQKAGVTNLRGENTYSGGTIVEGGELVSKSATALPQNTAYTVNGGVLKLGGNTLTASSLSGTGGKIDFTATGLVVNQSGNTTFGGELSGSSGGFQKKGAGELKLTGASSMDGSISADGGSLVIAGSIEVSGARVGTFGFGGSMSVSGGDAVLTAGEELIVGETGIPGTAVLSVGEGGTIVASNNAMLRVGELGTVNVNEGGTLRVGGENGIFVNDGGVFHLAGGTVQVADNSLSTSAAMSLSGAGSTVDTNGFNATLGGSLSGTGGLRKAGEGVLVLKAENTYSGVTEVAGGTLRLEEAGTLSQTSNIAVGESAVMEVNIGGPLVLGPEQTLSGNGSVMGYLNISGTVSPGSSTGVLTLGSGAVVLGEDAIVKMELMGTDDYDQLILNGDIDLDGTLSVSFAGGFAPEMGETFQLFQFNAEVHGTFSTVEFSAPGYAANLNYSTGNLTFTAVPEPSVAGLVGAGILAAMLRMRRKKA